MDERNNRAIVDALELVAQALQGQQNHQGDNAEFRGLGKFQRNNLPTFKGIYNSDGAQAWLREIIKIFRVMACTEVQKVQFDTHMLSEEAEDQWDSVQDRSEVFGIQITRVVCSKKEIKFIELKQGNMIVSKYAAKFEELVNFYPRYNGAAVEGLKRIKFESVMHPKIKQELL